MLLKGKYRSQMPFRMGRLPDLSGLIGRRPVIWLHALSFGEVNAAMPLLNRICRRWPDAGLVCSASTSSGYASLQRLLSGTDALITAMPLDLPPLTSRVIKRIKPDCFVLVETDIWPGLIWSLKKMGIPALLVNGSISADAADRLAALRRAGFDVAGLLYGGFHTVAMQSADDKGRLEMAAGGSFQNLLSAGNLKFDIIPGFPDARRRESLMRDISISRDKFVVVAGSTHEGEEEILLECLKKIVKGGEGSEAGNSRLRMIIAPRDPARAGAVTGLAESRGISACLRTGNCTDESTVIVLDTLGELADIYSLGDAAFVGGSLVPVGGHNLLEPAVHGIPVFFGPHVESCRDMADLLQEGGGGRMVNSASELEDALMCMLSRGDSCRRMGRNAAELVKKHRGAADRYLSLIQDALSLSEINK